MKRIFTLGLVICLGLLAVACGSVDYEAHARAIEEALAAQLSADGRFLYYTWDPILPQIQDASSPRRAANAYRYDIMIYVPSLASLPEDGFGFVPPQMPEDLLSVTAEEAERYEQAYAQGYEDALVSFIQGGHVSQMMMHSVNVTVEKVGGEWVCSKPYVGWIRDEIFESVEARKARAVKESREVANLRQAAGLKTLTEPQGDAGA